MEELKLKYTRIVRRKAGKGEGRRVDRVHVVKRDEKRRAKTSGFVPKVSGYKIYMYIDKYMSSRDSTTNLQHTMKIMSYLSLLH